MMNQIWSYGGGTQSAAIAALIVQGKLPHPDIAVIADTGREPQSTWDYLRLVVQPALPFKIHVIPHSFDGTGYNYVDLWSGKNKDTLLIPAFTSQAEGEKVGMLRGFCSNEWKRDPVRRYCREQGFDGGDQWIGFSTDELQRCRTYNPADKWRHIYPLIDIRSAPLNRGDCIALVERMGWPTPPRSACWMCPYRSDQEWQHLSAAELNKAAEFETEIQKRDDAVWLHKSCQPIEEIDFDGQPDLFGKPCASGMCFT